jgi:hypothetical protein
MPDTDEWRCLYQQLPKNVYDRLKVQMRRLAQANGIAPEYFDGDSKFKTVSGPKVQAWECLTILMERSSDESFRV